MHLQRELK